jgi:hypothetical protein
MPNSASVIRIVASLPSRTMAQRDECRVRRADLRLQDLACPVYQPGGGRVRE